MKTANQMRVNRVAAIVLAAGMAAGLLTQSAAFAQERAVPITGQPGTKPVTAQPAKSRGNVPGSPTQPFPGGRQGPVQPGGRTAQPGGAKGNAGGGEDAARPGGEKEKHEIPAIDAGDDMIEFSGFAEAVELTTLVEIAAATLHINIWVDPDLAGSVVFNAPVKVKKEELLPLLESMLNMFEYTMQKDAVTGWYKVTKNSDFTLEGEDVRTQVIPTPGIRPSSLKPTIDAMLGGGGTGAAAGANRAGANRNRGGNPGIPQPGGEDGGGQPGGVTAGTLGGSGKIAYNDELGFIIVTDTPRKLERFKILVDLMMAKHETISLHKIPLTVVSPSVAKQRILELYGQATAAPNQNRNRPDYGGYDPNQGNQPQPLAKTTMDNIGERLSTDPNGNNLFFRGNETEVAVVTKIVQLIDSTSNLTPKPYYAGAAAKQIADIAKQRGLGEITTIQSMQDMQARNVYYGGYYDDGRNRNQQSNQVLQGGPVMVVDEGRGSIIYYATETQHAEFEKLIEVLRPEDDTVVIRNYRLTYGDSKKIAEILMGLINNQTPTSNSDVVNTGGNNNSPGGGRNTQPNVNVNLPNIYGGPNPNELALSGRNTFALADEPNNQVLVKAPLKEQALFSELINKLDLNVPQVSVEAKIVAVSATDTFRLAFETQLINANGTGGVFNTNFGLGTYPTNGDVRSVKTVPPLSGGVAALIKSDQVPIIIAALKTQADGRVLSNPQIMMEANADEGTIDSKDQQPTQEISRSDTGNNDIITAGNYVDAGTKLTVKKPQIGPGDSVKMDITASLSSFTGEATATLPPPKQDNTITTSVRVPSNMTVVIGGVTVDSKRHSIEKIPLLGDLPFIGTFFSSERDTSNKTVLYIFLTPKICRDPGYRDFRLLTAGPMAVTKLDPDLPAMKPVLVDIFTTAPSPAIDQPPQPPQSPAPQPETQPQSPAAGGR